MQAKIWACDFCSGSLFFLTHSSQDPIGIPGAMHYSNFGLSCFANSARKY